MNNDVLYIVVPCYNEHEVLPSTHATLSALLQRLVAESAVSPLSRVLYVDDGSSDDTWALISNFACDTHICGVRLSANAGQQNALMAGLEAASERADIVITLDADGQDDANVIVQMLHHYRQGCDIVLGVRNERNSDTWFKRNTAQLFYKLMSRLGAKSVYNHADFRLMSRRAVQALLRYGERNLYLRGLVVSLGYKRAIVPYSRQARSAGESKYNLGKMVSLATDGLTSFSIKPVRMVLHLGMVFLFIAAAILVYVLVAYFSGRAVSGWSSVILSMWFIGGCILLGLGIVGEYIGKIYIETKHRPRYNIEQTIFQ